ncbi:peptidase M56 BlaR1 [Desulfitobacterium hafniense DCB-2]|uniref:Peptidase, M56 family n=2 Tax=Desulfitobacterium hafniense TaxID=49338 RepID=G9XNX5_DESHA|nr:M56 family metallopeptidase [Desulfitobacterium hafniense]ACL21241.1 peptidase M56 BlaR1 [Desulfitobacterium hafniense DCB-2]EHL06621.1 peptidase, M56 family [Desulfitobacterium hafniense DP7]
MIETVMTSSVLILIVVALRQLLRGRISSRLQYALWLLVAIRLLLPFSLFESPISVLNALPKQPGGFVTVVPTTIPNPATLATSSNPAVPADPANPINPVNPVKGIEPIGIQTAQNNNTVTNAAAHKTDYGAMATYLWLGGILASGGVFVMANVRLSRKLRRSRQRVHNASCPLAVYVTEDLPSPCLYGLWKPSIYLTPPSLADEQRITHVIAHELTHYRHGDHIWSLVRVLCLCIHWFNPLVWLAVVLSRQDSELACDEGTLRVLGEKNRMAYGKTLIEMMTASPKPADLFYCATTMTGGKGEITERIKRIAQQPRMLGITVVAVLLIAAVAIAGTFGGAHSEAATGELSPAEALWRERTNYVGDNSAVGRLIGLLPVPEGVQYDHFKLHTGEQPYDIELVYSVSSEVLKQYDTEEARQDNPFRQNALILLALVDNAGGIRATLTDGQREVGFINGREWADYTVGEDVRNYAESPEKLQELMGFSFASGAATQVRTHIEGGTLVYDSSGIVIKDIESQNLHGFNIKGKVMLISDPKRVTLAVTEEIGTVEEKLTDMVSRSGAIAGINAGGIYLSLEEGNEVFPDGITVQNGEVVYNNAGDQAVEFIGLDAEGKLITGPMNVQEIKEKNIQEGVGFSPPLADNGTTLVREGKPAVPGDGGWGIAPRAGIGQRADGTLIFMVIDGRDPDWSIGATLKDMENLFLEYGAVEAVNLSGGSMVEMVYDGKVLNKVSNIFGERPIPTGFVVMP